MSLLSTERPKNLQVAFLGFGEAATAIVSGWSEDRQLTNIRHLKTFDIARDEPSLKCAIAKRCDANDVTNCPTASTAISGADIVLSLVTADQTLAAAQSVASTISPDTLYLDCNSSAPTTKRSAAALITSAGARYVDAAIMSPIQPQKHKSPMLMCGPSAQEASKFLTQLNMTPTIIEGDVGTASAVKMVRSVMMKGMEALMAECALASHKAGISDHVFASLEKSYPGINWVDRCAYNLERMMVHGKRRAAEMREASHTVAQLGLDNSMSRAAVHWQQIIGDLGVNPGNADFYERADKILDQIDLTSRGSTERDNFEKSIGEPKWA